jgi:hypothetical protein
MGLHSATGYGQLSRGLIFMVTHLFLTTEEA